MNSDPHQRLMFAIWTQALSDINRGYLLSLGINKATNPKTKAEIQLDAKEAEEWIREAPHTFQLTAGLLNIPIDIFRDKTLQVIETNKKRIKERSPLTTQLMYTTVSRFRDYNKAFIKNNPSIHITVS